MARVRSPAYPALSLSAAVDMIRKVHSVQQTMPEPRDVVLKHMGYSGVNGRALKSISALIKYGFLVKSGRDGLKVSERAISILFPDPEDPEARQKALYDASREPALFKEIFDRWDGRPSKDSLEAFLIKKEFNLNSVESVARAFYETYDLVSGLDDSYDSDDDDSDEPEDIPMSVVRKRDVAGDSALKRRDDAHSTDALLNVTKPLFDFETVTVRTKIDNKKDLKALIERLQQVLPMLPDEAQQEE